MKPLALAALLLAACATTPELNDPRVPETATTVKDWTHGTSVRKARFYCGESPIGKPWRLGEPNRPIVLRGKCPAGWHARVEAVDGQTLWRSPVVNLPAGATLVLMVHDDLRYSTLSFR